MPEELKQDKKEGKRNPFVILTVVFAVLAIVFGVMALRGGITGKVVGGLTSDEAGQKVLSLINNYMVEKGTNASLAGVKLKSGLYEINILYAGQQVAFYLSTDGALLGVPGAGIVNFADFEAAMKARAGENTATEVPKTEKPQVELYVMSFCPYGVQAENAMIPVVNLLGNKTDIKIKFIVNVQGDTIDTVQSLHGLNEAKEDARQLAIMQLYPDKYWQYLEQFNAQCYSKASDSAALEACWKQIATTLGMNASKIEETAYGSEGIALLKQNAQDADENSVTGSPTLIINGVKYSGSRTAEAFKQAICNAFSTAPSECSQQLSSTTGQTSGNCG